VKMCINEEQLLVNNITTQKVQTKTTMYVILDNNYMLNEYV